MDGVSDDRALWLRRYILPLEPALRAWLSQRPLGGLEVDDIIQEAYTRLVSAKAVSHIGNHRAYLFQTAKSVISSHVRRASLVQILTVSDLDLLDVAADEPSAEEHVLHHQQLRDLAEAIAALPEPTRTVFCLRRVEQMPQRDISRQLRMPESTVEKHISRALLFLMHRFTRGGSEASGSSRAAKRSNFVEHDQRGRQRD